MKQIILILTSILISSWSLVSAQSSNYTLKGIIQDNESSSPLPSATLMLLEAKDSVMNSYNITNIEGEFLFKRIKKGNYVIQVSFLGYHTYFQKVAATGDEPIIELGVIKLLTENTLLDGIVVTGEHVPIMIKGDTVEYNAAAFKTQTNATVEDLLKKLPGIEVEADGTVKAHGEEVKSLTIDGKTFFGDDPKIATKNLPADAVSKVQVFDKKSALAEFTGIDDGERNKTINLTLKEDKKNGMFGKVSAGYGSDNRYTVKANINSFKKKTQVTVLGGSNNVNQQGSSEGGNSSSMGGGGFLGSSSASSAGNGITETLSAGLNLNHEFTKKTEVNLHYFYNDTDNSLNQESSRQNFDNMATFNSSSTSRSNNENFNHRLNYTLEHKVSEKQEFSLNGGLSIGNADSFSSSNNQTFNTDNVLSNEASSTNNGTDDDFSFNSAITWRNKFDKAGRNMTMKGSMTMGRDEKNTSLLSSNRYALDDPLLSFVDNINQSQPEETDNDNYELTASYTEPLGKKRYLIFTYNWKNYRSDVNKQFYDIDSVMQIFNSNLSSDYNSGFNYNIAGAMFTVNRESYNFNVGSKFQIAELNGEIVDEEKKIDKRFDAVLPAMNFRYNFSTTNYLRFNYTTQLQEPSISQLQPTINNTNTLNVFTGNPELKASYIHNMALYYMNFNMFNSTGFIANIRASYTKDKITNQTSYDAQFRQKTQPINVDRDYNIGGFLNFNTPIKAIGTKINITSNIMYNNGIQFISSQENSFDRWTYGGDVRLENRKKEIVDIAGGMNFSFNTTKYSLNRELNQEFFTTAYYSDVTVNFLKRFEFNSSIRYTVYQGDAFGDNLAVPIWRAHVAVNFLKFNKGQLKLSIFDILNENVGVNRSSNLNYIEEDKTTSLARYGMLTFTYSLSKFGGNSEGRRNRGFMMRHLR